MTHTPADQLPLDPALCRNLPDFAGILARTFKLGEASLRQIAAEVKTYPQLRALLRPLEDAVAPHGLRIRPMARPQGVDNPVVGNILLAFLASPYEAKDAIFCLTVGAEGMTLLSRGLAIDLTLTGTDNALNEGVLREHLKTVKDAELLAQLLTAVGEPPLAAAREVWHAAAQICITLMQGEKPPRRVSINDRSRLLNRMLREAYGPDVTVHRLVRPITRTEESAFGHLQHDVVGFEFRSPHGYRLSLTVEAVVLDLGFARLHSNGASFYDGAAMVKHFRAAKQREQSVLDAYRLLKASAAADDVCPRLKPARLRVLRALFSPFESL